MSGLETMSASGSTMDQLKEFVRKPVVMYSLIAAAAVIVLFILWRLSRSHMADGLSIANRTSHIGPSGWSILGLTGGGVAAGNGGSMDTNQIDGMSRARYVIADQYLAPTAGKGVFDASSSQHIALGSDALAATGELYAPVEGQAGGLPM